ncbi:MAG: TIGR02530 family flagellar biosynthesis protein [Ruminiclostridium sp.]
MLINELKLRNLQISTGNVNTAKAGNAEKAANTQSSGTFAEALQSELDARNSAVGFSKHAMKRIESRNIEILDSDMLQRLNDGIEIAAEKGSNETLVLVDKTAFVVSVKNRTVITTMSQDDLKGNIFTNIDSTVIM